MCRRADGDGEGSEGSSGGVDTRNLCGPVHSKVEQASWVLPSAV
jgi:hypothetical protein